MLVSSDLVLDGIGRWAEDVIPLTNIPPAVVAAELKRSGAEFLINLFQ